MNSSQQTRKIDWVRYLVSLIITLAIFGTVFYISNIANAKRSNEIRATQDKIAIDLLSSETQFSLLKSAGCTQDGNSILAPEIGKLGERLSYLESQLGADNQDVIGMKKYYSLLQIKDYLLGRELSQKCAFKPIYILYFYKKDCPDCESQGYALTALREKYPELRVYSFDADLDLSAIATLETIYKISSDLPELVINEKKYTGFQSIETIEKLIPDLKKSLEKPAVKKVTPATTTKVITPTTPPADTTPTPTPIITPDPKL